MSGTAVPSHFAPGDEIHFSDGRIRRRDIGGSWYPKNFISDVYPPEIELNWWTDDVARGVLEHGKGRYRGVAPKSRLTRLAGTVLASDAERDRENLADLLAERDRENLAAEVADLLGEYERLAERYAQLAATTATARAELTQAQHDACALAEKVGTADRPDGQERVRVTLVMRLELTGEALADVKPAADGLRTPVAAFENFLNWSGHATEITTADSAVLQGWDCAIVPMALDGER